jgi:hypothetical protein
MEQMMHANPSMRPTATEIVNHPHILPRSAPASILLEVLGLPTLLLTSKRLRFTFVLSQHAQHYQSVTVKKH